MGDWFDDAGNGKQVDAAALLDSRASDLLTACVQMGALVAVGMTSDGGALGVTVTMDGRWRREYFRDSDELVDWMAGAAAAVEAEAARLTASSAQRQRPRRSRGL